MKLCHRPPTGSCRNQEPTGIQATAEAETLLISVSGGADAYLGSDNDRRRLNRQDSTFSNPSVFMLNYACTILLQSQQAQHLIHVRTRLCSSGNRTVSRSISS